jgi:hypothetical protein
MTKLLSSHLAGRTISGLLDQSSAGSVRVAPARRAVELNTPEIDAGRTTAVCANVLDRIR